jgi:UPF0755 protein
MPRSSRRWLTLSLSVIVLFFVYIFTLAAPFTFPSGMLVTVKDGETISQVASDLKAKHIIRSKILFEISARIFGHSGVIAGEYSFAHPQSVLAVSGRLTNADYQLNAIKVTIPDGSNAKEITSILSTKLADFNDGLFYITAKTQEGRLYPDTYFFLPGEDAGTALRAMENNFNTHVSDPAIAKALQAFGKPINDVLTMASILEKEAPDMQSRRIIAGILWKRIALGMPLQVDAPFLYFLGKNSFDLTTDDLAINSPYNTYVHTGLPPGPIDNPSIDAILAAVTPIASDYLYYLSDKSGNLHFAVTYDQHLANKRKYLGT